MKIKTKITEDIKKAAQILGALGDASKSEKKKKSSVLNGKKGGRPKKNKEVKEL